MPKGWISKRVGELGRVVTGKTPSTKISENFGGPYPFITIPDLDGRVYISETSRTLSELGANAIQGAQLPAGAVMISCIATIGRCGITAKPSFTNQQINSVIPNKTVDARFLYYVFTQLGKELERAGGGGSVYTNVSKSRFSNIAVRLPSRLSEQQEIAAILGALDDKIELNRRMSETLGRISRALFQEWVIDRLKAVTSWDTSKWGSRPLDDIADFLNGAACQRFPVENGEPSLPVIKIRELNQGITPQSDRVSVTIPQKWHIQDGDVLFSWSGTLLARIWTGGEAALNQHLFKVTSEEFPKWFYFHWVLHHLDVFRDIAADKATTMGHIRRHHLSEAICFVPDADSLENMSRVMEPLLERQFLCELESRTLAELRDALLPKLISGELRVPDAEQLVSEVA